MDKYRLGDIVRMRKTHPCGSDQWEIIRVGADFKLKCLGCGRRVMLPRPKFERAVKEIVRSAGEE
ncbi:DUF951 domain-containing protein [Gelria sp. Kuro-4]|uniref:DUF951 domain-containing protein n=1 Tax=Gelria sp. Kuro-4 TaxID=2796927 RepID=UPI001BEDA658|nr:DUF951 domain-containing protein [Gelria sp. Kuro-4]BCV23861.1 hypothetical protein kuro4_06340 [Gelria sp. Kuro-4]